MSGRDWQAFDAELSARVPELIVELLGKPSHRAGQDLRWGRKGSLSVVIAGDKAGMWFDHETGNGGGFVDLVGQELGLSRSDALEWTADRIGMGQRHWPTRSRPAQPILSANAPVSPQAQPDADTAPQTPHDDLNPTITRAEEAAARAAQIWRNARPALTDHPYLTTKQVAPLGLRMDARGHLVVPLQDGDGRLHSVETIAPDGAKRFLAGGAKRGHFALVGAEPAPLTEPTGPILICEGWATGASLHLATGHAVIAAMDAGNLLPVAQALRARFPQADIVVVADNDVKPDRDTNPGVEAARKAALTVDARLAVPNTAGDANDLFCAEGPDAVTALVVGAARIPPPPPTYPAPVLTPEEARSSLAKAISTFMAAIPEYWAAVEATREAAQTPDANRDPLDFNLVASAAFPPLLGLPVDVGLGKTSSARAAIADLIASGGLGTRKVVYAVPRHDLGAEQIPAFTALGAVYICMSSSELHTLQVAFKEAGGHWSTFVIWAKDRFTLGRSDYQRQYEPILYGWPERAKRHWCGDRNQGDVWQITRPHKNDLHPTMKPVSLVERALRNSSQRGDLVLDPFGGSGTTLIAAEATGRRAALLELDPKYVDVILCRWQEFTGREAVLAETGRSFASEAQQRQGST